LDEHIKKVTGPIPEKELTTLFTQILDAIGYAHEEGLVHRDIKPSNIMIDKRGRIKVLDFGIAKMQEEEKGLTKTGIQIGTAAYMSPEQVNAKKVDKLSDIYSLGVTLFQMAVGKAPYAGQTNQFKIQLSIVSNPFPKAKDHYPSVSDKLEAIIEKATQKKKAQKLKKREQKQKTKEDDVEKPEGQESNS
jgi:serine/threonine-protein kinase